MTTLLLLDASDDLANLLRMVLEPQGVRLIWQKELEEGVRMLRETRMVPDAIFCSVFSPSMDGLRFLRAVRTQTRWASIPVVMLGDAPEPHQRLRSIESGADAFLAKPIRFEELKRVLLNLGVIAAAVA